MANEYLKRTPTSTGNRKVFTWAGWIKRNTASTDTGLFEGNLNFNGSNVFNGLSISDNNIYFQSISGSYNLVWQPSNQLEDVSSWYHIFLSHDSTQSSTEAVKIYVNGTRVNLNLTEYSGSYATYQQNTNWINTSGATQSIGTIDSANYGKQNIFDVFFIDGQALTPDVFGYYKKGDGYISAGSTQATDFKKGQWVPKAPKVIRSVINARGGFGVNGFYLPMNDSSNFGADFHCGPNSIIKLKGENFDEYPQPRNGAPETTDAYVSQLRADPYAANLVLAVPGIALENTNPELITNGTFDTNTTGWTTHANSISSVVNGVLKARSSSGDLHNEFYQNVTTVIGTRYTVSATVRVDPAGSNPAWLWIDGNSVVNSSSTSYVRISYDFTATSTTTKVGISERVNSDTYYDNISLKVAVPVRDYSADIKGSGTNKTLTANGNAGVGYEIPSYYGSALSSAANGGFSFEGSDFAFGSGDFTFEGWFYISSDTSVIRTIFDTRTTDNNQFGLFLGINDNDNLYTYGFPSGTGVTDLGIPAINQWHHVAVERNGSIGTVYLNGVAVSTVNMSSTNYTQSGGTLMRPTAVFGDLYNFYGYIQDVRVYKGVAKYKGGFDVPKPYTPVGIETWRAVPDCTANNFATLNGTSIPSKYTVSNGNLTFTNSTTNWTGWLEGTVGFSTGKYYWETRIDVSTDYHHIGIVGVGITHFNTTDAYFYGVSYQVDGRFYAENNSSFSFQGGVTQSKTIGDIVMLAVDMSSKKMWIGKNGTWFSGDPATGSSAPFDSTRGFNYTHYVPFYDSYGSSGLTINFGQNPTFSENTTSGTFTDSNGKGLFKYEPPSGFLSLCEDNLPTPAISDPGEHFKCVLYTGDGNDGRSITGVGFKPDLVWIKSRNASGYHQLMDSVRGAGIQLYSNATLAEAQGNYLTSFDNDGFSINYNSSGATNDSGTTYTAWCWRAGAGTTSTNTDGSITSVVSVNQDAGFSIVSYTGNSSSPVTIGHGLGKKPSFIIVRNRDLTSTWYCYHSALGATKRISLELTAAAFSGTGLWNNTEPSSTVFTTVSDTATNNNGSKHIAYCWTEIEGFSKFGSYVGNASADGPFVYCGFKPAWVMIKRTDSTGNWVMHDNARNSTNPAKGYLLANSSGIEEAGSDILDFLSNGFKIRNTWTDINASGGTYIFAAFAESPFKTANAK